MHVILSLFQLTKIISAL